MSPSEKAEIFQDGEIAIKTEALRDISKLGPHKMPIFPSIRAFNRGMARRRMRQATQHSHRRGFARAVRAEKTKDCSRFDLKGKILHSMDVTETLAQLVEHDRRFAHDETLLR